jgi:hypothetical protein
MFPDLQINFIQVNLQSYAHIVLDSFVLPYGTFPIPWRRMTYLMIRSVRHLFYVIVLLNVVLNVTMTGILQRRGCYASALQSSCFIVEICGGAHGLKTHLLCEGPGQPKNMISFPALGGR